MEFLRRRPVLASLGIVATLEWVVLYGIYISMSRSEQMELRMSPTIMVWTILGMLALGMGLVVTLVVAAVPPFRPFLPLVIGALLILAAVAGELLAAIAYNPTCGWEPS